MDKFVIRTPRQFHPPSSPGRARRTGPSSQSKIEDCSGVVNLKEFRRLQSALESNRGDQDSSKEVITELRKKTPSSKILKESGILNTLKNLDHCPEGIQLYHDWKGLLQKRELAKSDKIEVDFDKETERIRKKSSDLLLKSVSECWKKTKGQTLFAKERKIILNLEKELFHHCNQKSTNKYRRLSRKLIFALKQESACLALFKNPKDFLLAYSSK